MLTVSRQDAAEEPFVAMLLNSEEDLSEFDEPIAVPLFGRGRTYFALVGQGINEDTILENCGFVCGACSCQVKQANPGVDTLMAFDWSAKITGSAMREPDLPELTGFGPFEVEDVIPRTPPDANDAAAAPTVNASTLSEEPLSKPVSNKVVANDSPQSADTAKSADQAPPVAELAPGPEFEQSVLSWAIGGTTIAALIVFVVSFLFRRPA
jgi:hypothetical protein